MSPSHGTSGQNVQKSDEEAEKVFLQENSFVCEEPEEKPDQSRKRRILRKVSARKRRAAKKPLDTNDSDFQTTSDTFTERQAEEFADKKVRKAADRAEKAGRNLKKAKAEIPVQKNYTMQRIFDEKTGKAKYLLVPVEKEKPFQPESLKKRAVHRLEIEGVQVVHGKIAEAEKENTAVEGAHKSEQALESAYHYAKAHGKGKEQRKREQISRLEKKKMKADVELAYQEFLRDNPHLNEEGIHKQLQKQLQKKGICQSKERRCGSRGSKGSLSEINEYSHRNCQKAAGNRCQEPVPAPWRRRIWASVSYDYGWIIQLRIHVPWNRYNYTGNDLFEPAGRD